MAIGHATRADQTYVFIRQKIIDGTIPFGSRLHIDNLAQETGFSITPVREALARLETYGLAQSFPHKGVFVVSPCEREVTEMCEGRLCLESYMAKAVVQHATEADIQAMRQASERALNAERALTIEPAADLVFEQGLHGRYARVAQNQFLEHLYQRVMTLLNVLYIQGIRSCEDEHWVRDFRRKHYSEEVAIADAIAARDLSELEEAVTTHVHSFQSFLLETLRTWPPQGLNWER
jgi:DNA-binding GntR family transcriptional regulator